MKKSEAIGILTRATLNLEELSKYEADKGELDLTTRNFEHKRLIDLKSFLSKLSEKEFAEISGRSAEVKFTHQTKLY